MKSGWVDSEAQAAIDRYARDGISRDLALRVYTTRLIGRDPKLVLHGGGNTSVKTTMADLLGEEVAVLCVKGSGSDMATIEPAGLPAVQDELGVAADEARGVDAQRQIAADAVTGIALDRRLRLPVDPAALHRRAPSRARKTPAARGADAATAN